MKNKTLHSGIKKTPYGVLHGCSPRNGLSITSILRKVFDSVEDEQQFENALFALTASSERADDAILKETALN